MARRRSPKKCTFWMAKQHSALGGWEEEKSGRSSSAGGCAPVLTMQQHTQILWPQQFPIWDGATNKQVRDQESFAPPTLCSVAPCPMICTPGTL